MSKIKDVDLVKARVLVNGVYGQANDVVVVSAHEAEQSLELDAHEDAVTYAESLKAEDG